MTTRSTVAIALLVLAALLAMPARARAQEADETEIPPQISEGRKRRSEALMLAMGHLDKCPDDY